MHKIFDQLFYPLQILVCERLNPQQIGFQNLLSQTHRALLNVSQHCQVAQNEIVFPPVTSSFVLILKTNHNSKKA
jgi:hypothetical protein